MSQSFGVIQKKLAEQMDIAPQLITPESNITDDLGLDSLDSVELIIALEDEFHINIESEDAEQLKTVGDVADLVDRLTA